MKQVNVLTGVIKAKLRNILKFSLIFQMQISHTKVFKVYIKQALVCFQKK